MSRIDKRVDHLKPGELGICFDPPSKRYPMKCLNCRKMYDPSKRVGCLTIHGIVIQARKPKGDDDGSAQEDDSVHFCNGGCFYEWLNDWFKGIEAALAALEEE